MGVCFTMEWNGRDSHVVAEHRKNFLEGAEVVKVAVFELGNLLLGDAELKCKRSLGQPPADALADDHFRYPQLLFIIQFGSFC